MVVHPVVGLSSHSACTLNYLGYLQQQFDGYFLFTLLFGAHLGN